MKIKELIYQTPEMSEEKLLELIDKHKSWLKTDIVSRIYQIHGFDKPFNQLMLEEYDLIQDKKSLLSKSQRNIVLGFVGTCMIIMTKGEDIEDNDEGEHTIDGGESSSNSLESISEIKEVGND